MSLRSLGRLGGSFPKVTKYLPGPKVTVPLVLQYKDGKRYFVNKKSFQNNLGVGANVSIDLSKRVENVANTALGLAGSLNTGTFLAVEGAKFVWNNRKPISKFYANPNFYLQNYGSGAPTFRSLQPTTSFGFNKQTTNNFNNRGTILMASKRSSEGDYNSKDYPPVPPSNGGGSGGSGKPPRGNKTGRTGRSGRRGRGGSQPGNRQSNYYSSVPSLNSIYTGATRPVETISTGIPSRLNGSIKFSGLDTNVVPLYTNAINVSLTGMNSSVAVGSPTSKNQMYKAFSNLIWPHFRLDLQQKVNFSIGSDLKLTQLEFANAFETVGQALSLYYTVQNVIDYNKNRNSNNVGLEGMYDELTPDILQLHGILEDRLNELPIPGNISAFLNWLFTSHTLSPEPGVPVLKFNFGLTYDGEKATNSTEIVSVDDQAISTFLYDSILSALEIDMKVWGIMAKAYPELLRTPTCLPTSVIPVVDQTWSTVWTNTGFSRRGDSATIYIPTNDSSKGEADFPSWTNNIDGMVLALMTRIVVDSEETFWPGIVYPADASKLKAGLQITRTGYYDKDGYGAADNASMLNTTAQIAAGWFEHPSNTVNPMTLQKAAPAGTLFVENVVVEDSVQATDFFARWLYGIQ
jgi:hypothetical protein